MEKQKKPIAMKLPKKTLKRIRRMKHESLLKETAVKERILERLKKQVIVSGE
jgi:alpha-beta hydrolase superfamily lysophospholipase